MKNSEKKSSNSKTKKSIAIDTRTKGFYECLDEIKDISTYFGIFMTIAHTLQILRDEIDFLNERCSDLEEEIADLKSEEDCD